MYIQALYVHLQTNWHGHEKRWHLKVLEHVEFYRAYTFRLIMDDSEPFQIAFTEGVVNISGMFSLGQHCDVPLDLLASVHDIHQLIPIQLFRPKF
jgi:hypothetical protein